MEFTTPMELKPCIAFYNAHGHTKTLFFKTFFNTPRVYSFVILEDEIVINGSVKLSVPADWQK